MTVPASANRKSADELAFEHYLRTGERLTQAQWQERFEVKFNPNHDERGRFTFAFGGASSATARRSSHVRTQNSSEKQKANLGKVKTALADKRVTAFLDLTAQLESGSRYNVVTGGGTFSSYSKHPNIRVGGSTAAGAYQITHGTWQDVSSKLGLTDFSPQAQKYAATALMNDLGVIEKLQADDLEGAIYAAGSRWQVYPKNSAGNKIGSDKKYPQSYLKALKESYNKILKGL